MSTREELIAQFQRDPQYATLTRAVGKETVPLTGKERDDLFGQWADAALVEAGKLAEDVAKRGLRRQVRLALTALDADIVALDGGGNLTVAQMRAMLSRTDRVLVGLIRVLIDLDLIEREG